MKKYFYLLVLLLLTLFGCVGPGQPTASFLDLAPPRPLPEAVTLLPILDSRDFPPDFQSPDLAQSAQVLISAEEVMKLGEQVWRKEGLVSDLRQYQGVLPDAGTFTWNDFPLRDIDTDLALGLELKSLNLKKIGPNSLLPAHAVLDAALMPLFAAGALATDGHVDLAARMIPSSRIKFTVQVDLNFISLKAGGHFFTKTYLIDLTDPLVSDRDLYKQAFRSSLDGQEYGLANCPKVIEKVFTWMARDPELQMLPQLVKVLWLGQVMSDDRTTPNLKLRLLEQVAGGLELPPLTAEQIDTLSLPYLSVDEKLAKLEAQSPLSSQEAGLSSAKVADPVWVEQSKGRRKIFEALYQVLLGELSRLGQDEMTRPLAGGEKALQGRILTYLVSWGRNPEANRLYRATIGADKTDIQAEKAVLLVLGRDLEALGNDEFVKKITATQAGLLTAGDLPEREKAAALLVGVGGDAAEATYSIPRRLLLAVLSGEDSWAGPMVLQSLANGDFSRDVVRLAGALNLRQAVPALVRTLDATRNRSLMAKAAATQREIPLVPAGPDGQAKALPDAVTLVRALGCFSGNPGATRAVKNIVDQWRITNHPELTAEALKAWAGLEPHRSSALALTVWQSEWASTQGNPLIRRAALDVLAITGEPRSWAGIHRKAQARLDRGMSSDLVPPPFTSEQLGAFREVADFFGRTRYQPAVPMLVGFIDVPAETATLQQAAFNSLGLIADQDAETSLRTLAGRARLDQAENAAAALEKLVREKAVRKELERSF